MLFFLFLTLKKDKLLQPLDSKFLFHRIKNLPLLPPNSFFFFLIFLLISKIHYFIKKYILFFLFYLKRGVWIGSTPVSRISISFVGCLYLKNLHTIFFHICPFNFINFHFCFFVFPLFNKLWFCERDCSLSRQIWRVLICLFCD